MQSVSGEKVQATAGIELAEKTLIDTNADGYKYIGVAASGAPLADAAWVITRISGGNPQVFDHAPANSIWNDRTGLTYS